MKDQKYLNWCKYHISGCSPIHRIKRNVVSISVANSLKHELAKTKKCYELRKQGFEFITEAVENNSGLRRDVVCLDNNEIYEIETSKQRAKRFEGTNVNVIQL